MRHIARARPYSSSHDVRRTCAHTTPTRGMSSLHALRGTCIFPARNIAVKTRAHARGRSARERNATKSPRDWREEEGSSGKGDSSIKNELETNEDSVRHHEFLIFARENFMIKRALELSWRRFTRAVISHSKSTEKDRKREKDTGIHRPPGNFFYNFIARRTEILLLTRETWSCLITSDTPRYDARSPRRERKKLHQGSGWIPAKRSCARKHAGVS